MKSFPQLPCDVHAPLDDLYYLGLFHFQLLASNMSYGAISHNVNYYSNLVKILELDFSWKQSQKYNINKHKA